MVIMNYYRRHRNYVNIYDLILDLFRSALTDSSKGPPRPIVSASLFPASEFRMQMGKTQVRYVTRMRPIRKIMEAKRFFFSGLRRQCARIIARASRLSLEVHVAISRLFRHRRRSLILRTRAKRISQNKSALNIAFLLNVAVMCCVT